MKSADREARRAAGRGAPVASLERGSDPCAVLVDARRPTACAGSASTATRGRVVRCTDPQALLGELSPRPSRAALSSRCWRCLPRSRRSEPARARARASPPCREQRVAPLPPARAAVATRASSSSSSNTTRHQATVAAGSRARRADALLARAKPSKSCRAAQRIAGCCGDERLHDDAPGELAAAGAARDLGDQLERALGGAEVGQVQARCRRRRCPTSVTRGKSRPLAIICVPTSTSISPRPKAVERPLVVLAPPHRVGVHARDARVGQERARARSRRVSRADAEVAQRGDAASRTLLRAARAPRSRSGRPGATDALVEGHATRRSCLQRSVVPQRAAPQDRREAAAVEEQDRLLAARERVAQELLQRSARRAAGRAALAARRACRRPRPAGRLAARTRSGSAQELVASARARCARTRATAWRSRARTRRPRMRARIDGHVARVVARRALLLERGLVLLVDDDHAELAAPARTPPSARRRRRALARAAPRATSPAAARRVRRLCSTRDVAEARAEPADGLRRQRDLGHEHDRAAARARARARSRAGRPRSCRCRSRREQEGRWPPRASSASHDPARRARCLIARRARPGAGRSTSATGARRPRPRRARVRCATQPRLRRAVRRAIGEVERGAGARAARSRRPSSINVRSRRCCFACASSSATRRSPTPGGRADHAPRARRRASRLSAAGSTAASASPHEQA